MTGQSTTMGIDVAKRKLDYCIGKNQVTGTQNNDAAGHAALVKLCRKHAITRVICEATGGYEKALAKALRLKAISVFVVMPLRVRCLAIAEALMAKTDRIDARLLVRFGEKIDLVKCSEPSAFSEKLRELVQCRRHLTERLAELVAKRENAGERTLKLLEDERVKLNDLRNEIESEIRECITQDKDWAGKIERMQKVRGVGPVVAASICALVPEIGTIEDKSISALLGLAPYCNQSGLTDRMRHIRGGRKAARDALYMAAVSAMRCNPILRSFYHRLKEKGKHSYVCLTAVMRKLICLLNRICADPDFILS